MLSDSPPDRDLEWTDSGIGWSFKFINKIWRLLSEVIDCKDDEFTNKDDKKIEQGINLAINKVTENVEKFHFNKSVANLYEAINLAQKICLLYTSDAADE